MPVVRLAVMPVVRLAVVAVVRLAVIAGVRLAVMAVVRLAVVAVVRLAVMAVVRLAGMVRVIVRRLRRRAMMRRLRRLRGLRRLRRLWRRGGRLRRIVWWLWGRVAAAIAGICDATLPPLCAVNDLVAVVGRRQSRSGPRVGCRGQIGSERNPGTAENNRASEHERPERTHGLNST
jgi:hypothetical protein